MAQNPWPHNVINVDALRGLILIALMYMELVSRAIVADRLPDEAALIEHGWHPPAALYN